jgi:hypothetical protein
MSNKPKDGEDNPNGDWDETPMPDLDYGKSEPDDNEDENVPPRQLE